MNRLLSLLILCLVLLVGMGVQPACAQFDSNKPPAEPPLQFGQKNPQLKTILALQEQLQLLRRLIDHENAVNQMVIAATAIHITDPVIPTPDREICNAVPANIPCAQAYPSLYSNYSVAPEKHPVAAPVSLPIVADAVKEISKEKKPPKAKPMIEYAAIFWTNITCLNERCSAVISGNPKDPKASYRIMTGEKLPDGSVIHAISAAGVTILRDNKIVQLDPAPQA
jgi:hypothetical protein